MAGLLLGGMVTVLTPVPVATADPAPQSDDITVLAIRLRQDAVGEPRCELVAPDGLDRREADVQLSPPISMSSSAFCACRRFSA